MQTEYQLPDEFPDGLTDKQLEEVVKAVAAASRTRVEPDLSKWLPELKLAVLQAALLEQSRRQSDAAVQSSKRTARYSLAIAAVALLVSAFAGVLDYRGDESWQDEQTRLLSEIRDRLPAP